MKFGMRSYVKIVDLCQIYDQIRQRKDCMRVCPFVPEDENKLWICIKSTAKYVKGKTVRVFAHLCLKKVPNCGSVSNLRPNTSKERLHVCLPICA
ncbi:hypothetical protein AVEN_6646-1 [Araneus ventricosus]|uniref:Uncharacterized protein n=1 Tax=Araneus ventricosus TaxID=182803 RepID=A0A4Y2H3M6_ARAVE|nr:hypothetical protein AVEN_6646-1 [Araneus ventricosus]